MNIIGLKVNLECPKCGTKTNTTTPASTLRLLKAGLREIACNCKSKEFNITGLEEIIYIQDGGAN